MSLTQKDNFVYILGTEVKPLEGCQLDPKKFAGASVRVYIPAQDGITAMGKFLSVLKDEKFSLIEIAFFFEKSSIEWENRKDEIGEALVAEALAEKDVIFGEFGGWGYEDFH